MTDIRHHLPDAPPAPPPAPNLEPLYWLLAVLLLVGIIDLALTGYVAYHLWRFISALHQLGG